jgi:hypothetical protein
MAGFTLDRTLLVGTDIASFYLYHPDDLAHRDESPHAWHMHAFACREEFEAGRLVGFSTGGDGGYRIRVTTEPLTEREQNLHVGSWEFRLRVRLGQVLLDGGYCLPNSFYAREVDLFDEGWIELPNGDYRVTVHSIDWSTPPVGECDLNEFELADALPHYVITFATVNDLRQIPIRSDTPPTLECHRDYPPKAWGEPREIADFDEEKGPLTHSPFIVLEAPEWLIVPGFDMEMPISDAVSHAAFGRADGKLLPDRAERFVLAPLGGAPGDVAVLARPDRAGKMMSETLTMTFHGMRVVRIAQWFTEGDWDKVRVESIDRPEQTVAAADLIRLKEAFAEYAARNVVYRRETPSADFEAKRVLALTSPESVTNCLIHHIRMSTDRRLELLLLPVVERVPELRRLLAAATLK